MPFTDTCVFPSIEGLAFSCRKASYQTRVPHSNRKVQRNSLTRKPYLSVSRPPSLEKASPSCARESQRLPPACIRNGATQIVPNLLILHEQFNTTKIHDGSISEQSAKANMTLRLRPDKTFRRKAADRVSVHMHVHPGAETIQNLMAFRREKLRKCSVGKCSVRRNICVLSAIAVSVEYLHVVHERIKERTHAPKNEFERMNE